MDGPSGRRARKPDQVGARGRTLTEAGAAVAVALLDTRVTADTLRQAGLPDVLVCDISASSDPVFSCVEDLRANGYGGPVVFVTARVTPELRQRARELGVREIAHPDGDIVQVVEALIGRSRIADQE